MPNTVRELGIDEWDKLLQVPPYNDPKLGGKLPNPERTRIAGVFNSEDRLIGYWHLFETVHIEPLWLSPEVRHAPHVGYKLLELIRSILQESNVGLAFAIIFDKDADTTGVMAERLGFREMPGKLFYLSPPDSNFPTFSVAPQVEVEVANGPS